MKATAIILLVLSMAALSVAMRPALIQTSKTVRRSPSTPFISHKHYTDVLGQLHSFMQVVTSDVVPQDVVVKKADVIQQFINDQLQAVQEEAAQHLEIKNQQDESCSSEIFFRNLEIATGQDALKRSQAALTVCTSSKLSSQTILTTNQNAQSDYNAQEVALTANRQREHAIFQVRSDNYEKADKQVVIALDMIDNFETALDQHQPAVVLAELTKKATVLLQHTVKIGGGALLVDVLRSLVQLSDSNVSSDDIENLRRAFETLETNINNAWNELKAIEAAAVERYNANVALIQQILAILEDQESKLQGHIADMDTCIHNEEIISGEASQKVERNQDLLDKAQTLCASYAEQYEAAVANRNNMVKIIRALEASVNYLRRKFPLKFADLNKSVGRAQTKIDADAAVEANAKLESYATAQDLSSSNNVGVEVALAEVV